MPAAGGATNWATARDSAMLNPAISEIGAALEPLMDELRNPVGRALRIFSAPSGVFLRQLAV